MSNKNMVFLNWMFFNSTAWNYEKYQGLGYASCMIGSLKKIYKHDSENLHKSVATHMNFFNCNSTSANLIIGACLAIEEEKKQESLEAISSLKTGLMGALAGIGDTIFIVIPNTIIGSISAYMAMQGSYIGVILFLLFYLFKNILSYYLFNIGYKNGTLLITTMGSKMKNLTTAANCLGMMIIGSLISVVVKVSTPISFNTGNVNIELQQILDDIIPGLLPVCVVVFTYWLLGLDKINSTKVIFILMIISMILSLIKVIN